jgi:hypothetical protein
MTLAFLALFLGLAPFGAMSVIDGEEERWITTGIGWTYRIPYDNHRAWVDWFPVLLPSSPPYSSPG